MPAPRLLTLIAVSICFLFPAVSFAAGTEAISASIQSREGIYERAVVESVGLTSVQVLRGAEQLEAFRVRFLSGPLKGESHDISGDVGSNPYRIQPAVGDKLVIFMQSTAEGTWNLYIEGFDRRFPVIALLALFVLTLALLSGWQGIKVAGSIIISVLLIGYVLIPLFLRGYNPVPAAILLSGVLTLVSSGLTIGWNRKAFITAVGTMGGAMVAYGIAHLFGNWAHMSGVSTEEDRLFFNKNPLLNPAGLLFAGIIIAAVGVVEDVAVSIASAVSEVRKANANMTFRQLFLSGMVVGREHMGALANTLVFAYVGGSLSTLLLYHQSGGSWLKFINFDVVVDEILRSLAGTIGLVFTVPITALLSAWLLLHDRLLPRPHPVTEVDHDHET